MSIWKNESGHYVKCDSCGHTVPVDKSLPRAKDANYFNNNIIRPILHERHWSATVKGKDYCPVCSADMHGLPVSNTVFNNPRQHGFSFTGEYIQRWCEAMSDGSNEEYEISQCRDFQTMKPNIYYYVEANREGFYLRRDNEKSPKQVAKSA